MNNSIRNLKIIAIAVLISAIAYLWSTSPGKVVVKKNGEILGFHNIIRSELQGQKFWIVQGVLADKEYEALRRIPENHRKFLADLTAYAIESNKIVDAYMEDSYRRNPGSRPSPAAQKAEELREIADQLESDERSRVLDEKIKARMRDLIIIKNLANKRANF
jgi:hypothetical protein